MSVPRAPTSVHPDLRAVCARLWAGPGHGGAEGQPRHDRGVSKGVGAQRRITQQGMCPWLAISLHWVLSCCLQSWGAGLQGPCGAGWPWSGQWGTAKGVRDGTLSGARFDGTLCVTQVRTT